MPFSVWRSSVMRLASRARTLKLPRPTKMIEERRPMIATTIRISISVKPFRIADLVGLCCDLDEYEEIITEIRMLAPSHRAEEGWRQRAGPPARRSRP